MENQELYKQAILDAKAVRETAMAAAKESLAEAFEPRIKEMLRLKLSEELEEAKEDETVEEADDKMEEGKAKMEEGDDKMEEAADMEDTTLDEILAELDAMSEEPKKQEPVEEYLQSQGASHAVGQLLQKIPGLEGVDAETLGTAVTSVLGALSIGGGAAVAANMGKIKAAVKGLMGGKGKEDAQSDSGLEETLNRALLEAEGDEEATDDEKVVELTVGELKDLFRDVFAQVQGGGADMMAGAEEEGEIEVSDEEGAEDEELKELSLDEILAELEEEDSRMEEAAYVPGSQKAVAKGDVGSKAELEEKKKAEKELEEARKAVQTMRTELQEVNLLNAKLLYVNKLLKAKPLTEAQKIKVLNAFDRATTVREAENIYKTLNESLTASNKSTLKESFGYASKPAGSAPAKPIVEVDAMVSRWQTIAGIKK